MGYDISMPDAIITACFLIFFVFLVLVLLYVVIKSVAFVIEKINVVIEKKKVKNS